MLVWASTTKFVQLVCVIIPHFRRVAALSRDLVIRRCERYHRRHNATFVLEITANLIASLCVRIDKLVCIIIAGSASLKDD